MKSSPTVSIIMPAFNAAKYLHVTLNSVLNQSFNDWELLIINDCSTDDTASIVSDYKTKDCRIRLINLPKNMGAPAGPRNIGIRAAEGKWIAFLDADDIWHPEKLRIQISILEKTGSKFCSTQMVNFCNDEIPALKTATDCQHEWVSYWNQLIRYRTPTSSVVADRSLMLRFPFNEDPSYKAREDLDCWLRCHEALGRTVKITSPLMGYRIIEGQISGKKWLMFKRHFHVLRNYRLLSGRQFSTFEALTFTLTHFGTAFYFRLFKKGL